MIKFVHKGDFSKTEKFLRHASEADYRHILEKYAQEGVSALASATPVDSGKTADSWSYEISINKGSCSIIWTNSNVNKHVNIAIILQYGHGTRNGGYVQGRDYINPAIRPIFDSMADEAWSYIVSNKG